MNINRDYLIINDVKKSNVKLDNGSMFFYITDKNTQNIFVNLVINVSNNELIQKFANIENAEDYTLTMNIVKPDNTYKVVEGKLHDKEKAIFEFDLNEDCCDEIGTYRCELLTKCNINDHEEITTSNKITYKVKSSVLNDLDDIVEAPEYPIVIQLFDKLSDIEQYEEDRRANELARQLAEEQRQTRFNTLDADMTDRVTAMDDKMVDIENRVSTKEQAVDKLITDTKADIDNYKVAKDQEIDDYKVAKDAEINEAITAQDNKIDEAISEQNDRITAVENNVVSQNNRLDIVENKNAQQDNRLTAAEAKNVEQDNRLDDIEAIDVAQNTRLDAIEVKNQQQDDRLLDIEKVNKRQDMNLKCLFAESKNNMIDVTEEGNSIYLQNSTTGYTLIDEIKGNTLVNCNKEPDKELILNGNINTSGDNTITITEGVDGGLVDVALEGNTLVNVSKTKDSTAITKAYTVENSGNHIALQGEYDGKCRPVITGNTLVNVITHYRYGFVNASRVDDQYVKLQHGTNENTCYIKLPYGSCLYKPRTTYTLVVEIKENTSTATLGMSNIGSVISKASSINIGKDPGKYFITFETKDDFSTDAKGEKAPINDMYFCSWDKGGDLSNHIIFRFFILEGDYTNKPIPDYFEGLQSSFEDNLVTQEMVDNGEEVADNLGKYRVDYKSTREDGTVGDIKTLYLNSPLLEGDTIEEKDNGIYHVHRYGKVVLDGSDDEGYTQPNAVWGDGYSRFSIKDIPNVVNGILLSNNIICDKYPNIVQNHSYSISSIHTGSGNICIVDSVNTLDEFRAKLQSNPVIVVYQLASPTYELIEQSNLAIPSYANGYLDLASAVPVSKVNFLHFEEELTYLYPSTSYTVQFMSDKAVTIDIALGGTKLLAQNIVKGLNRISITTPATLVDNKLIISGVGANISEVVVTDTNREFGYFEGMKSVGECEGNEIGILSQSNLAYIKDNNQDDTTQVNFDIANIKTGKTYTIYVEGEVDKGFNLINGYWQDEWTFIRVEKVKDSCYSNLYVFKPKYDGILRFNGYSTMSITSIMLVEGEYTAETMPSYVPPQSNTQQLTHEPLRAVGEVKDRYVLIDGKWFIERRCGYNDIEHYSTINDEDVRGVIVTFNNRKRSSLVICDSIKLGNLSMPGTFYINPINIVVVFDKNNPISNEDMLEKVSQYNFVYELATPTYEPIDYNPLEVYSDVTHITTNSTIPTNIVVKNHGFNCLLKPSTTYTISSNLGLNTVTTPAKLTEDCLRFMDTDTSDVTTMKNVLVLEGDWTSKADLIPANFSGIESAFEQEYDAEKGKYKVTAKVANEDKTKENNIAFYINEPLRGVGDVKDKVYVKDDKVVVERNCASVTFDGSDDEKWSKQGNNWDTDNRITFRISLPKSNLQWWRLENEINTSQNRLSKKVLSDKFIYIPDVPNNSITKFISQDGNISFSPSARFLIVGVPKNKLQTQDVTGFKQWLQQNPITVAYQLAEPTYEEVEYNDTKLFIESFKNSTLSYNSNVPVSSKLYYSYSVPIVDKVTQTANITDEQDSMIIDLATQCAVMEMMLM